MTNTHYALINEDNDVVAVIRKENFKGRIVPAIEDETDSEVDSVSFEQIEYNSYKVSAKLFGQDTEYTAILRPTWEY